MFSTAWFMVEAAAAIAAMASSVISSVDVIRASSSAIGLTHQAVLRLGENAHEIRLGERLQLDADR